MNGNRPLHRLNMGRGHKVKQKGVLNPKIVDDSVDLPKRDAACVGGLR